MEFIESTAVHVHSIYINFRVSIQINHHMYSYKNYWMRGLADVIILCWPISLEYEPLYRMCEPSALFINTFKLCVQIAVGCIIINIFLTVTARKSVIS
jgi:hypothetical protein